MIEAKNLLNSFFQDGVEKYDFNEAERTGASPFFLQESRILKPSKKDYLLIRKWLHRIKESSVAQYGEGKQFFLYNALLIVLAAMELCVDDSRMESWEADPFLQFLNKK